MHLFLFSDPLLPPKNPSLPGFTPPKPWSSIFISESASVKRKLQFKTIYPLGTICRMTARDYFSRDKIIERTAVLHVNEIIGSFDELKRTSSCLHSPQKKRTPEKYFIDRPVARAEKESKRHTNKRRTDGKKDWREEMVTKTLNSFVCSAWRRFLLRPTKSQCAEKLDWFCFVLHWWSFFLESSFHQRLDAKFWVVLYKSK